MADEDDRRKFIESNLKVLPKSTVIGIELVIGLISNGLIDEEQRDLLSNNFSPNITRAVMLYTSIASRWNRTQFEDFKKILEDTGNLMALQIFTNAGADVFLTNDQVQVLRLQRDKSECGCYEGLSLEDELVANQVVHLTKRDNGLFKDDGKFEISKNVSRRNVIPLVIQFTEALKNDVIWWNERKPPLPTNHIPRRVARTNLFQSDGSLPPGVEATTLIEDTEDLFLLVDPPGMGKSSEITHLEQKLRSKIPRDRIIVRVNLNEVQRALLTLSPREDPLSAVLKLAPFLPPTSLHIHHVALFVLLDGLDEVCPRHQETMLSLLRVLTTPNNASDLRVVVTTRPHLRAPMESAFHLESWSLIPLTVEEQHDYMESRGVSSELLIRDKLPSSLEGLLSNPLMLSMFVDVLQSGVTLSAADVNVFDLYSRFLDSKHKLHVTQKEGMREEDNYTEIRLESMLEAKLPQYHRIAIEELIHANDLRDLYPNFTDSRNGVLHKAPSGLSKTDLLSIGLVLERSDDQIVFKHRSFAEFFYARLLTHEECLQQTLKDSFFGFIYGGRSALGNVEAFLSAALSKKQKLYVQDSQSLLLFPFSPKWLLIEENFQARCQALDNFVGGSLFPLLGREVLLSFVEGHPDDLWEVLCVLLSSKDSFSKLFGWMSENRNRDWVRTECLKIREGQQSNPEPAANLMVAIALQFGDQDLLSEEEVGVAVRSCDHKLIRIVVQINAEGGRSKWEFIEAHLKGRSGLRELLKHGDEKDFSAIVEDLETAWKVVQNFSVEEFTSLLANKETRVSDIVGEYPKLVWLSLGEEFVSRKQLAEFRAKFGDDKGKTLFEMRGCYFGLKVLWEDLLREMQTGDSDGPVRVALREAIGRGDLWPLIQKLENKVFEGAYNAGGVVDFVLGGDDFSLWANSNSLQMLPFIVRYFGGEPHPHHVISLLQKTKKEELKNEATLIPLLQSLILSACCHSNPSFFSFLATFLQHNLHQLPPELAPLAEVLLGSSWEELLNAVPPHCLVRDVSVGEVFLNLAQSRHTTSNKFTKKTWMWVVSDVIEFSSSTDLPSLLEELRLRIGEEKTLKEILTSGGVLRVWESMASSSKNSGGLPQLLSFYFSVFGLTCDWMKMSGGVAVGPHEWVLVNNLPLEIGTALGEEPRWTHLLLPFQEMLREFIRGKNAVGVGGVGWLFGYTREAEWDALLKLIIVDGGDDEFLQVGTTGRWRREIPSSSAAPLIRTLMRMWGFAWTSVRLRDVWTSIPSGMKHTGDSLETLGSLLHSAIELGELEEVKRRAWQGLVSWKNLRGKNALDIAREKLDSHHPITKLLYKLNSKRRL